MKELSYNNRREKAEYISKEFRLYLYGKILDVGCGEGYLRNIVSCEYIGIDKIGSPDVLVNIERNLPFKNKSFECVICTDVLEHLEYPYYVFDELVRVGKDNIIISLPNCWYGLKHQILKGKGNLKFYGLPVNYTIDRHKWLFNYNDAKKFILKKAVQNNLEIISIEPLFAYGRRFFNRFIHKAILQKVIAQEIYENLFSINLWAVLKK